MFNEGGVKVVIGLPTAISLYVAVPSGPVIVRSNGPVPTGAELSRRLKAWPLHVVVPPGALITASGDVQPTPVITTEPFIVELRISTPPGPDANVVAVLNANGVAPDVAPGRTVKSMEYRLKSAVGKELDVPAAKSTVPVVLLKEGEIAISGMVPVERFVIAVACNFELSNVKCVSIASNGLAERK